MALADLSSQSVEHTVTIEDAGPSRKRLNFKVPAKALAEKMSESLDAIVAEAALPGFRPGRAPRRLVERKFGSGIQAETKNQIVSAVFSAAVQEHKLEVVGDPEGNEDLARLVLDPSKELSFYLEVEVMPDFQIPSLSDVDILKPLIEPTEAQVADQIQRLQINEGSLAPQDRATAGDYCIGHGVMRDSAGKSLVDINGAVIQLPPADKDGKGAILGVLVDDFSAQIGTPAPGDTVTVRTKGPENHENEDVRGKDVVIEYKVDRVERIIPASVQELVERYGLETEERLREMVMVRLRQRALVEQHSAMQQQAARHLLDHTSMLLPERLTSRQAERNLHRARVDLMYRGLDETQIEERVAQLRRNSSAAAVRDLKLMFILNKAATQLNVQVTQEDVMGRVAQIASERGVPADKLARELHSKNQLGHIAQQIREHKALDAIIAGAKVTEVPVDEFNTRMKAASGA